MTDADALSRAPCSQPTTADRMIKNEITAHVQGIMCNLPASDKMLHAIRRETNKDKALTEIRTHITEGWPDAKNQCSQLTAPYWEHRSKLTILKELMMLSDRIVILQSLQTEILTKIHAGHCGIEKCKQEPDKTYTGQV